MSALTELANRSTARASRECGVAYAIRVLDPAEGTALIAALANADVRHSEISDALADHSIEVATFAIGRHRLGRCRCAA